MTMATHKEKHLFGPGLQVQMFSLLPLLWEAGGTQRDMVLESNWQAAGSEQATRPTLGF